MHVFHKRNAAAEGCGKRRAVESEENQKQVFHRFPPPLEIPQNPRDSHFSHSPDCWLVSQITSGNLIVVDRKECLTPDTCLSFASQTPPEDC